MELNGSYGLYLDSLAARHGTHPISLIGRALHTAVAAWLCLSIQAVTLPAELPVAFGSFSELETSGSRKCARDSVTPDSGPSGRHAGEEEAQGRNP